jgi:tetratricopeptide (TPR) repeat protein
MVSVNRMIVFVGNCQLEGLANLYRRIAARPDDTVVYLPSYQEADAAHRRAVADADLILRQVLDLAPRIGDMETRAETHLIPHISAAFLWPCTGSPHPRNAPAPFLDQHGPYPPELGDSFLDRLIAANMPADEAVRQYLATDIATVRHAERMAEIMLDNLRARDRTCGTRFADMIAARFRDERLFRSPNHPTAPMTAALAIEAFGRLGVDAAVLAQLEASPPDWLFPLTETPIHPSIIARFGLRFVTADTRYLFFNEGRFTFAEFAGRYMRYEWNPLLAEAFHLFWQQQEDAALDAFMRAVPTAPRSAVARLVLSELLGKRGRLQEAFEMAREATELEPDHLDYRRRYEWLAARLSEASPA